MAAAFVCLVLSLVLVPGCAREQQLTSIQIQPSAGATFGAVDPALFVSFKAFGTYMHPPQQKDITSTVTWHSDTPQVVQVSTAGVVSPNTNCGQGNVFATLHDKGSGSDIVSNSAAIVVNGPATEGCTPAGPQPILTVQFPGTGTGTVSSSPAGLSCTAPTTCSNSFAAGTSIVLTASPTGTSTFAGWSNCDSFSGLVCTVNLQASRTVTAVFNH
jgi:hypothetical protein